MIGFGTVFSASVIALALVVQSYYKPQQLFKKARFADEILGGVPGPAPGGAPLRRRPDHPRLFFLVPNIPPDPQELPFLRDFWGGLDNTQFALLFRNSLIPAAFVVIGLFVPDKIKALYSFR